MNLEFQSARATLEESLSELQTTVLLVAQLQNKIIESRVAKS